MSSTRYRLRSASMVSAFVLGLAALAGCGSSSNDEDTATASDAGGTSAAGGEELVAQTSGGDLKIAVITHGDGGSFWTVAQKGAEDAGKALGVEVLYQESTDDPQKQAQFIDAAVSQDVDGIAVSAPNADAIKAPLAKATEAGIPIVTLNSGSDQYSELGAFTHVGQDESIAGKAAGEKIKAAGGKKVLCVINEQNNIGLNQRCAGVKESGLEVENLNVKGTSDIATSQTEVKSKLQSDDSFDWVLALNPDIGAATVTAVKDASSGAKVATFDLSPQIIKSVKAGDVQFAVDQQQYLQGYLSVVFLKLFAENANTPGGGQPVLTGPGFVDKDNAATVEKLAGEGSR